MGILDRLKGFVRKEKALSILHYDPYLQYDVIDELARLLEFELYIRGLDKEGYTAGIFKDRNYQRVIGIDSYISDFTRREQLLHAVPRYGYPSEVMEDAEKYAIKSGHVEELYGLAEELKGLEEKEEGERVRRKILKLLSPYLEQRAKKEFDAFLDKYLEREERWREQERLDLLRKEKAEVRYEEACNYCDAPVKLKDFRKGQCGYCGHNVRNRIRRKIEEGEPVEIKVRSGTKQLSKAAISVILILCLIFGIGSLFTKRLATGHAVFAYNSANWPAVILLLIPLILVLFWLKKR